MAGKTGRDVKDMLSSSVPGRFLFCPVIGTPSIEGHCKQEPCDKVRSNVTSTTKRNASTTPIISEHPCSVCGARLRSSLAWKQHVALVHGVGWKYGQEPGEVSADERAERHRRLKPHGCDLCAARFSRRSDVRTHRRVHTGGQPFSCDLCEATFPKRSAVETHKLTHTREKAHACEMCDARFSTAGSLRHHERSHVQGRSLECRVCDRRFATEFSLKKHSAIHSGRRPHVCELCGVRFSERGDLVAHEAEHASE